MGALALDRDSNFAACPFEPPTVFLWEPWTMSCLLFTTQTAKQFGNPPRKSYRDLNLNRPSQVSPQTSPWPWNMACCRES